MTTIIKIREGVELLLSDEEARKIVLKELSGLVPETAKVSDVVTKTEEVSEPEVEPVVLPAKRSRFDKHWKSSEDKKLLGYVRVHGNNSETFYQLSVLMGRSVSSLRQRFCKLLRSKKSQVLRRSDLSEKKCLQCGSKVVGLRKSKRFCSAKCRNDFNNHKTSLKKQSASNTSGEVDFSKKVLVFDKKGNQARTLDEPKKCLQCGSLIDMSIYHSRNWANVKFCSKKCRTEYHSGYHHDGSDVERVDKGWTKTEDEQLIKELMAGGFSTFNYERIARLLHRSLNGVRMRVCVLRKAKGGRLW